jgi:hypothetical protein
METDGLADVQLSDAIEHVRQELVRAIEQGQTAQSLFAPARLNWSSRLPLRARRDGCRRTHVGDLARGKRRSSALRRPPTEGHFDAGRSTGQRRTDRLHCVEVGAVHPWLTAEWCAPRCSSRTAAWRKAWAGGLSLTDARLGAGQDGVVSVDQGAVTLCAACAPSYDGPGQPAKKWLA